MPRLAAVLRSLLAARLLLFFLFVALVLLVPTASNAHAEPGPDGEVAGTATEQEPPPVEPAAPDVPAECAPPEAPADTAVTPSSAPPAEGAGPEAPADTAAAPRSAPPGECAPPEPPADPAAAPPNIRAATRSAWLHCWRRVFRSAAGPWRRQPFTERVRLPVELRRSSTGLDQMVSTSGNLRWVLWALFRCSVW